MISCTLRVRRYPLAGSAEVARGSRVVAWISEIQRDAMVAKIARPFDIRRQEGSLDCDRIIKLVTLPSVLTNDLRGPWSQPPQKKKEKRNSEATDEEMENPFKTIGGNCCNRLLSMSREKNMKKHAGRDYKRPYKIAFGRGLGIKTLLISLTCKRF